MSTQAGAFGSEGETGAAGSGVVRLALAWSAGIVLAAQWPARGAWIGGACAALGVCFLLVWRGMGQPARWSALVCVALVGGAWLLVQRDYVEDRHVSRFVHDEPGLARVRGVVVGEPREVLADQSTFGAFNYRGPGTMLELEADAIDAGGGFEPAAGGLVLRIKEHDHRPALGQRIEAVGWLSAVDPAMNPGEFDYRAYLRAQGVSGEMTLMQRGNWLPISDPPGWTLTGMRRSIGDAAAWSLRLGMPLDEDRTALLDALLLGRRSGGMSELSESFRAVGLSHVLAISGAHLAILLLLVWALGRLLIGWPSGVSLLVLVVLVLFLLAVPWRTPIVRAAIMAGVFCVGYGMGRRLTGVELLSAAALIVLVWKPGDLFSAGFQLSFGVVGAILLFAKPVSRWMLPEPDVAVVHPSAWDLGVRWVVDYTGMSVVAFAVALPLVMHHFQIVSPLAVLLSLLALPVLTLVLALGYLKVLAGLVSPAVGSLLAVPVAWAGDSLSGLVVQSQRWPGASFTLLAQPSVAWVVGALGVVVALLSGGLRGRRPAMVCCVALVVGWAWVEQRPGSVMDDDDGPALVLNMFAVGDGSCYLLRSGDEVLMFDCGSQGFWRVGERSIVPALGALGVRRIDTLMLSHADLDHFVGVVDVVERVEVGRVLVSPDLVREAEADRGGTAAFLFERLRALGQEPEVVERGWRGVLGEALLEMLWPAPGYMSELNNNNALVLRVEAAGRRVLLSSDVQGDAIDRLMVEPAQLRADVADLAHHGSYVDQSPAWLSAVGPMVVLQSSGHKRRQQDPWAQLLKQRGIKRLRTSELGMVELTVGRDGLIGWSSHLVPD